MLAAVLRRGPGDAGALSTAAAEQTAIAERLRREADEADRRARALRALAEWERRVRSPGVIAYTDALTLTRATEPADWSAHRIAAAPLRELR